MAIWRKIQINERNTTTLKTTSHIKSFLLLTRGQQAQLLLSESKESKKAMPSQAESLSPAH